MTGNSPENKHRIVLYVAWDDIPISERTDKRIDLNNISERLKNEQVIT